MPTEPAMETGREAGDGTVGILELMAIAGKRRRMILSVTAAAFVLSIAVSLLLPKVYTATARFLPPQQDSTLVSAMMGQAGGLSSFAGGLLGGGTPADTYVGILRSEGVRDRIIDRFSLMRVYDEKYRVDMYRRLDRLVDISAGKKDGIVSVAVDDGDPKRAAAIANSLVEEAGSLTAGMSATGAGDQRLFLERRLAGAKADLARAEELLSEFQAKNKAPDVTQQARAAIEGIAQLKAQQAVQEVQLATLRTRLTDGTQEVLDLKTSIFNLKGQIARLEGRGESGAILGIGAVPELGRQYVGFMREFKVKEAVVDLLTKQYEVAKLTEAKEISNLQVIQQARVPDKKSRPRRVVIVLASTFAAFALSVLSSFGLESLERMTDEERVHWNTILGYIRRK
jgi:tyrosine-protein kinase Etk/Wzc